MKTITEKQKSISMAFRFLLHEFFAYYEGKRLREAVVRDSEGVLGLYDPLNPLEYE